MKKKKHLVIATYDGVATHYSGVGTIAKNIIDSLNNLDELDSFKVSIAYVNTDKDSGVFNPDCFSASKKLVEKTGGFLIPLYNGTKGETEWDMWRSFDEWNLQNESLVTSLNTILKEDEDNFIILNDTPFLFFERYKDYVNDKKLKYFYFPLSSGKNHDFGDSEWRSNRIRVEQECFDSIGNRDNAKILALGNKFAERLNEDYGVNFGEEDFLRNGLFFDRYGDFLDKKFNNKDLEEFGINLPDSSKLIFSWGRCSIAKGFKELASAWVKIYKDLPNHHLVLQIPNNSGEDDYFSDVKDILKNTERYIVLDDFNPDIWKTVLRNTNTEVVCIPSLMDPFPHTSIEAKLFSKDMNYTTVISDVDGAADAFSKDEAIYVNPRNTDDFSEKILQSVSMNSDDKQEMIDRTRFTIDRFNFPEIMKDFIKINIK
jgi:hypothetical protein